MSLGKWILGGLGFAVGGPIGSIIGVLIATLFEKSGSDDQTFSRTSRTSRAQRHLLQNHYPEEDPYHPLTKGNLHLPSYEMYRHPYL